MGFHCHCIDRAEWLAADAQIAAARALAAEIGIKLAASVADEDYWSTRLAAINQANALAN